MVQRKPKAKVKTKEVAAPAIKQTACNSDCWLCSIFKIMVVLFVTMIVFWLGFCFGAMSMQGPMMKGDYGYKKMSLKSGMCSPSMDSSQSGMSTRLSGLEGEAFDREFLLQMTLHHEGGIEMAKLALEKSAKEEVKTFAQSIIDNQSKEIDQMTAWQSAWSALNTQ